jgi:hypothetical protein
LIVTDISQGRREEQGTNGTTRSAEEVTGHYPSSTCFVETYSIYLNTATFIMQTFLPISIKFLDHQINSTNEIVVVKKWNDE